MLLHSAPLLLRWLCRCSTLPVKAASAASVIDSRVVYVSVMYNRPVHIGYCSIVPEGISFPSAAAIT